MQMAQESFTIVNEEEIDIIGEINTPQTKKRLPCIIMSTGLLDTRKSPWVKSFKEQFLEAGYAVITFDPTNSWGESGGKPENATISERVKDLEKVVGYAKRRSYVDDKKIIVIGHCYGAMTALTLEGFEHILAAVVLISTPARIEATEITRKTPHEMMKVRLKRYFHIHHGDMQKEVRMNYSFYEDGSKLDMDRAARNLKTPALFIHGAKDKSIPSENSQRMFDRAVGKKKILIKENMGHDLDKASAKEILSDTLQFLKELNL